MVAGEGGNEWRLDFLVLEGNARGHRSLIYERQEEGNSRVLIIRIRRRIRGTTQPPIDY